MISHTLLDQPAPAGVSHVGETGRTGRRVDFATQRELLFTAVRSPQRLLELDLEQWDLLVRVANRAAVFSQLAVQAHNRGLVDSLPPPVRPHLESARLLALRHEVVTSWEIDRVEWALRGVEGPVVLLKGAAYQCIGLPTAGGRLTSDVDILVPRERLVECEEAFLAAGWRIGDLDPRDQAYFRRWLHELPPLEHQRRKTPLDVHHTILPSTDRLRVDPRLLIDASVAVPGRRVRVLKPADMFLHSAAHLFRNGTWARGIRDLMDLDAMVRMFGTDAAFWDDLLERARQLDLGFPCSAALRALDLHLSTPLPDAVRRTIAHRPAKTLMARLLDALVDRALLPHAVDQPDRACTRARQLLACWPVPRLRAMRTPLFWTKRLPRLSALEHKPTAADPTRAQGEKLHRPDD